MAEIAVRCRCQKVRTIDTERAGPWRMRCKGCGDVLFDPARAPEPAEVLEESVEDTEFLNWLEGSAELNVLKSSDADAPPCVRHTDRPVVAACTQCSRLLCKLCLDRVGEAFVCSECVAEQAAGGPEGEPGVFGWLRRKLGGGASPEAS